jgi:hypothetical protein
MGVLLFAIFFFQREVRSTVVRGKKGNNVNNGWDEDTNGDRPRCGMKICQARFQSAVGGPVSRPVCCWRLQKNVAH